MAGTYTLEGWKEGRERKQQEVEGAMSTTRVSEDALKCAASILFTDE